MFDVRTVHLLLTGASGLVGAAFARIAAAQGHNVTGIVGRSPLSIPGVTQRIPLDLSAPESIRTLLASAQVDAFVNCAAVAAPAECDTDPQRSHALNVTLPTLLSEMAQARGIRLVHLSSEQVFPGTQRTPYRATDEPAPINLYGQQKRQSELAVLAAAPAHAVIVRPPLMLGNSPAGTRGVHEALLATWKSGGVAKLFVDEFRQPCTADDLASVALELCHRRDLTGIFHWAGAELVSRHELGSRIARHFGLSPEAAPIVAVSRDQLPAVAKTRPACLALDTTALANALGRKPQTLEDQFATLRR